MSAKNKYISRNYTPNEIATIATLIAYKHGVCHFYLFTSAQPNEPMPSSQVVFLFDMPDNSADYEEDQLKDELKQVIGKLVKVVPISYLVCPIYKKKLQDEREAFARRLSRFHSYVLI